MMAVFPPVYSIFFVFTTGLISYYFIVLLIAIIQAVVLLIVDIAFLNNLKSLIEGLKLVGQSWFLIVFDCSQGVNRTALDNVKSSIICGQLHFCIEGGLGSFFSVALGAGLGR